MRHTARITVACALWLATVGGSAQAAPLGSFTGTLSLTIGSLPPLVVSGSGVASVVGSGTGSVGTMVSIPAGAFSGIVSTPVPESYAPPPSSLT